MFSVALDQIVKHGLPEPYLLYGGDTGRSLKDALFQIWNQFVDWANLPKEMRQKTNESAFQLLKRLGVSEKVAEMAVKHLPDLFEELASKAPVPGSGKLARFLTNALLKRFQK